MRRRNGRNHFWNVGLGTFQPIHTRTRIDQHTIHTERYEISEQAATSILNAKHDGRPILAIGTTVVRTLEDAAAKAALKHAPTILEPGTTEAEIFIKPGHEFRVVDQLITNFHLPQSTLLILVSAFAGRELILAAYRHAVKAGATAFAKLWRLHSGSGRCRGVPFSENLSEARNLLPRLAALRILAVLPPE